MKMKIYITLNNLFYVLEELDTAQKDLACEFIQYFEKDPDKQEFNNYWKTKVYEKFGESAEGKRKFVDLVQMPIYKIGQDLEDRLNFNQIKDKDTYDGPDKFLYEDIGEVIGYYNSLIEQSPNSAIALFSIGHLLMSKENPNYEGVIDYLKKAIHYLPTYRRAHFDLGKAYLSLKNIKNARYQVGILERMGSKGYAKMLIEEIEKVVTE